MVDEHYVSYRLLLIRRYKLYYKLNLQATSEFLIHLMKYKEHCKILINIQYETWIRMALSFRNIVFCVCYDISSLPFRS